MAGIDETYARATRSSDLKLSEHRSGDADTLIAAGLVRDGIGVDLLRLRADYDSVSGLPGGRKALALLRRMSPTLERLMAFADDLATSKRFDFTAADLRAVVVQVLDLYLDPNCPPCAGTGLVGDYGTVRNTCPACRGAKTRNLYWVNSDVARFAQVLRVRMDEKTDMARRRMQRLLRDKL